MDRATLEARAAMSTASTARPRERWRRAACLAAPARTANWRAGDSASGAPSRREGAKLCDPPVERTPEEEDRATDGVGERDRPATPRTHATRCGADGGAPHVLSARASRGRLPDGHLDAARRVPMRRAERMILTGPDGWNMFQSGARGDRFSRRSNPPGSSRRRPKIPEFREHANLPIRQAPVVVVNTGPRARPPDVSTAPDPGNRMMRPNISTSTPRRRNPGRRRREDPVRESGRVGRRSHSARAARSASRASAVLGEQLGRAWFRSSATDASLGPARPRTAKSKFPCAERGDAPMPPRASGRSLVALHRNLRTLLADMRGGGRLGPITRVEVESLTRRAIENGSSGSSERPGLDSLDLARIP